LERQNVAICGNGAASVALFRALAAKARTPLSVTILGSGERTGEGIAYGTRDPVHVLNVPAGKMSADASEPRQFAGWLERHGQRAERWEDGFVPRRLYAAYLADLVERTRLEFRAKAHLNRIRATVVGIARQPDGWSVFYEGGVVTADTVVLATGLDQPQPLGEQFAPEAAQWFADDPWQDIQVETDAHVLIVGTGLTAIDTALALLNKGHRGRIVLLSRHGLLPHTHVAHETIDAPLAPPFPRTASGLMRALRRAAKDSKAPAAWQAAIDALRPLWPGIWKALTPEAKGRAMRHGLAFFNIHRHRVPPRQGAQLKAAIAEGRVAILRGRLTSATPRCMSVHATIETQGGTQNLTFGRIVNCSGPNSDPERSPGTLLKTLIASGIAGPGTLNLGIDVDDENRVRSQDGAAQPSLFAAGALTRGYWWEITAMQEIAAQAAKIATSIVRHLANAGHADPAEYEQTRTG
jgi:uncharacterized NAD(P)/FAD-binding protein YdhS